MTEIMFVTENEIRRATRCGELVTVALADDGVNHMADWINGLLNRGYHLVDSFIDYRGLVVLRMEKPQ